MGGEQNGSRAPSSTYPKMVERPVGKQINNIYTQRLQMFLADGQYRGSSLLPKLYEAKASGEPAIKLSVYSPPNLTRPRFKDAVKQEFKPAKLGESFGPSWSTHWFKVQLTIPQEMLKKERLELHWDANNEGLVWTEHGEPLQGLSGGGERVEWVLPDAFRDGKEHTFYIEMACNGMFGNPPGGDQIQPPQPDKYFQLAQAEVVAVNLDARQLRIDFWEIGDAAREFPADGWQQHEALQVCNAIMDCFIAGEGSPECIKECRKIAKKYLGSRVDSAKVYEGDNALVTAIGHCHIDTCWLWPWAETKRKIVRSWLNQCNLMEQYPEHRFCCSQAQQYKWLKMYYPTAYDRVKQKVKEGRFHPIGGSWVEHDTNMPSGEALVRQFLYGQRFFESHFGERHQTFWLPDTFGYSSQLPQLCRLAGMSRFFTQKLSWNNINNFPHTTFNWVALDGSQVICHMAPSNTYTAEAHFGDVSRSVSQHKSLDQDATSLLVFGKGDGGGGPTWEHIEKLRRCSGISDTVGLLPKVKMGDSVDDFFNKLEKKAEAGQTEYVTWYGELYFELHRGTYTTQANNKRNNRRSEIFLHDLELLATYASIKEGSEYKYPKEQIDDMWEDVLLCQFHDCLPGSSIEMCYDDSDEAYERVFSTGEKILKDVTEELGLSDPVKGDGELVALNLMPWNRSSEVVKLPSIAGAPSFAAIKAGESPAISSISKISQSAYATIKEVSSDVFKLSNPRYDVTVSSGTITSLYDRHAQRELVPHGKRMNQLVLFDDKPLYWQAWDVEVYHLESRKELKPKKSYVTEKGPNRVALTTEVPISDKSWAKTTVTLDAVDPEAASSTEAAHAIAFDIEVSWQEDKKFLKVEFPTKLHNTRATYETQYGLVERPTHYNTSWDMAKFEVCCHKFADLSESTYGISILNDSKYGFATQGDVMRLSLLRAPKAPDAHADLGSHRIRYAILPHEGPFDYRTVRSAREFNSPLVSGSVHAHKNDGRIDDKPSLFPFTNISSYLYRVGDKKKLGNLGAIRLADDSSPNIVIDTIKRGEDDKDVSRGEFPGRTGGKSIIVRLYDSMGGLCRGKVLFGGVAVKKVKLVNLLEDEEKDVEIDSDGDKGFQVEIRAFEVKTFKLIL